MAATDISTECLFCQIATQRVPAHIIHEDDHLIAFLVRRPIRPGHALIMTRHGRVVWRYGPDSGRGELDHPSLALRVARDLIAVNDDFRHRVVLISIRKRRIVWQYGHTGVAGRRAGFLNTPDGLDLLRTADAERNPAVRQLIARAARARR